MQGGVFGDGGSDYNTNIYIMTPATRSLDLNGAGSGSLTNGDNPALYGSDPGSAIDRLSTLEEHLSAMMPGVPISKFLYQRQNKESLAGNGVYGSALVSLDDTRFTRECGLIERRSSIPTSSSTTQTSSCPPMILTRLYRSFLRLRKLRGRSGCRARRWVTIPGML